MVRAQQTNDNKVNASRLSFGLISIICLFIAIMLFGFIARQVIFDRTSNFDISIYHFLKNHSSDLFLKFSQEMTFLGSVSFLVPAYLLVIGYQVFRKKNVFAIAITAIAICNLLATIGLKSFFHRARPGYNTLVSMETFSFPSGHTLNSFVFFSIMSYIIYKAALPKIGKIILISLCLLTGLFVGLSRVIMGVHYATDVLASLCLAAAWVLLSMRLFNYIIGRDAIKLNAIGP